METPFSVAIAGLGLIGGSMVKALHRFTPHRVLGHDLDAETRRLALADGVIAEATDDFSSADVVLVALRPDAAIRFLEEYALTFRSGTLVVDLCGVKRCVCDAARPLFAGTGVTFIGGHPMAGRECFGYRSSTPDLFSGASMILTPNATTPPERLAFAGEFFRSLGFGHIEITTPEQLDIVLQNLIQFKTAISGGDGDTLLASLRRGRQLKEYLNHAKEGTA